MPVPLAPYPTPPVPFTPPNGKFFLPPITTADIQKIIFSLHVRNVVRYQGNVRKKVFLLPRHVCHTVDTLLDLS